jgi:hypothetical protein
MKGKEDENEKVTERNGTGLSLRWKAKLRIISYPERTPLL